MFILAPRLDMQVGLVRRGPYPLHGIVLLLLRQLLEAVVDLLACEVTLFDPAFGAGGASHLHESLLAIQDFDPVSILDRSDFAVHGGYTITQECLWSRNVHDFPLVHAGATASGCEEQHREARK